MNSSSTYFAPPAPEHPQRPRSEPPAMAAADDRVPIPPVEAMRAQDPMVVFAYACLRHELGALLAEQPADGAAVEPDAIHRMRIATRRLRVALRTFADMLPPKRARKLAKQLRWLARRLGTARDLDVHADTFREYAKLVPPQQRPELGGYELDLRRACTEARNQLVNLFTHPRVAALLHAFRELLDAAPPSAALRRWKSFRVADGAATYLRKSKRRVLRAGRKIDTDTVPEELHRLRIRVKRLRYELEFFAEVFPELEQGVKGAKRLQDLLGEHQDACAASDRLRDYARRHETLPSEPSTRDQNPTALERLLTAQEHKAADARARFAETWRLFEQAVGEIRFKSLAAA